VIEAFVPVFGTDDKNIQVVFQLALANVILQGLGPEGQFARSIFIFFIGIEKPRHH